MGSFTSGRDTRRIFNVFKGVMYPIAEARSVGS